MQSARGRGLNRNRSRPAAPAHQVLLQATDAHIDWAQRLIDDHDQGDFSLIGRPCVSSGDAWGGCAPSGASGMWNPCALRSASLRDAHRLVRGAACGQPPALDDLDNPFRRLADRGSARLLEAFDRVPPYRDVLP